MNTQADDVGPTAAAELAQLRLVEAESDFDTALDTGLSLFELQLRDQAVAAARAALVTLLDRYSGS